jgi:hypothetical protein
LFQSEFGRGQCDTGFANSLLTHLLFFLPSTFQVVANLFMEAQAQAQDEEEQDKQRARL